MTTCSYRLRFVTPAFLGNAEQVGQWRTPPLKTLLRQFWRMAYAAEHGFNVDVAVMRREEGLLFGHVPPEGDRDREGRVHSACKSKVRLRLNHWSLGNLRAKDWKSAARVGHPEVKSPVGSDLYLGYGPLLFKAGGTSLKQNAAIQADESAQFSLAFPEKNSHLVSTGLWLMDRFGTLGGRSRNGWGSFQLLPPAAGPGLNGPLPARDWQEALRLDWPNAIGTDGQGALIWQTGPHSSWQNLMKELAQIKIGLRTQFRFTSGKNAARPEERHWLSYPVTNHSVEAWERNNARLPNSLRFKARTLPGKAGQLVGVVFHMPCLPPMSFNPDLDAITAVWKRVHSYLDESLARVPD